MLSDKIGRDKCFFVSQTTTAGAIENILAYYLYYAEDVLLDSNDPLRNLGEYMFYED